MEFHRYPFLKITASQYTGRVIEGYFSIRENVLIHVRTWLSGFNEAIKKILSKIDEYDTLLKEQGISYREAYYSYVYGLRLFFVTKSGEAIVILSDREDREDEVELFLSGTGYSDRLIGRYARGDAVQLIATILDNPESTRISKRIRDLLKLYKEQLPFDLAFRPEGLVAEAFSKILNIKPIEIFNRTLHRGYRELRISYYTASRKVEVEQINYRGFFTSKLMIEEKELHNMSGGELQRKLVSFLSYKPPKQLYKILYNPRYDTAGYTVTFTSNSVTHELYFSVWSKRLKVALRNNVLEIINFDTEERLLYNVNNYSHYEIFQLLVLEDLGEIIGRRKPVVRRENFVLT